jgi:hypothetical protein
MTSRDVVLKLAQLSNDEIDKQEPINVPSILFWGSISMIAKAEKDFPLERSPSSAAPLQNLPLDCERSVALGYLLNDVTAEANDRFISGN